MRCSCAASLVTELNRLEKLKFVRKLGSDSAAWEVRKLLKARLPLHELEELRDRMMDVARAAQAATE
jgi:2-oxo-4-hydroxy-4-carboxy--5-ureidoimidazoline (OHCU) decarboxylase